MAAPLQLDQMSVEEKIQVMEAVWDDLRARADVELSPEWHGEILSERRAALEAGSDGFQDWADAKAEIEKRIK